MQYSRYLATGAHWNDTVVKNPIVCGISMARTLFNQSDQLAASELTAVHHNVHIVDNISAYRTLNNCMFLYKDSIICPVLLDLVWCVKLSSIK